MMSDMKNKAELINKILSRGVEEIIIREHLEKKLNSGRKLRVKLGIDPTAPEIHLGHSVVLRKLRQFQDAGHKAVLIIGDFTAQIGDPSGRNEERKPLTEAQVKMNMKQYLTEAGKILDIKKAEIRKNSEWHKKGGPTSLLNIARAVSIQQVLKRDDFEKRMKENLDVSMLETLYPILQGYDSIAVKADVELGGTDQKFNLLMGRRIQRAFGLPEQDVLMTPLVEGTDGTKKMSKSAGNFISLSAAPANMFGLLMSVPDALVPKYFILLTDSDAPNTDPYEAKKALAENIVAMYHGNAKAKKAREEFIATFSKRETPSNIPTIALAKKKIGLVDFLVKAGIESKSEARRLIAQGAVKVNQEIMEKDDEMIFSAGDVVKIGKKRFLKIK